MTDCSDVEHDIRDLDGSDSEIAQSVELNRL